MTILYFVYAFSFMQNRYMYEVFNDKIDACWSEKYKQDSHIFKAAVDKDGRVLWMKSITCELKEKS